MTDDFAARFGPVAHEQAGVVSRRQLRAAGATPDDLRRWLRRRDLEPVLPGVYRTHGGPMPWEQRAWVGLLFHWPAALAGHAAIRATLGPSWGHDTPADPIEIAVPIQRHVAPPPGYRIRRPIRWEQRTVWTVSPPRLRLEEAGLDLASRSDSVLGVVGILTALCGSQRTHPKRIRRALAGRGRIRQRALLGAVLDDLELGACSVLEHGYLVHVERAHALPVARRQAPAYDRRPGLRDVEYALGPGRRLVVELDGRRYHESAEQRGRDLDRDLAAAVARHDTVRLGWAQVYDHPCWTAAQVAALLGVLGWPGRALPCRPGCDLASRPA